MPEKVEEEVKKSTKQPRTKPRIEKEVGPRFIPKDDSDRKMKTLYRRQQSNSTLCVEVI
jgi:hypothetical protein